MTPHLEIQKLLIENPEQIRNPLEACKYLFLENNNYSWFKDFLCLDSYIDGTYNYELLKDNSIKRLLTIYSTKEQEVLLTIFSEQVLKNSDKLSVLPLSLFKNTVDLPLVQDFSLLNIGQLPYYIDREWFDLIKEFIEIYEYQLVKKIDMLSAYEKDVLKNTLFGLFKIKNRIMEINK